MAQSNFGQSVDIVSLSFGLDLKIRVVGNLVFLADHHAALEQSEIFNAHRESFVKSLRAEAQI